jgi:hypothetical protein
MGSISVKVIKQEQASPDALMAGLNLAQNERRPASSGHLYHGCKDALGAAKIKQLSLAKRAIKFCRNVILKNSDEGIADDERFPDC